MDAFDGLLTLDKNDFVISSFNFLNNGLFVKMGGLYDSIVYEYVFIKFNKNGNAIWLRGLGKQNSTFKISDMKVDDKNYLHYNGFYHNDVEFDPYKISTPRSWNTSSFLTKFFDYGINRDSVYSGPYCAGDSIEVSYKKYGEYDSTNEFIAELSDGFGNFNGGEYELGRITSTLSDKIKGILPIENVASSSKYRIRVRSTSPNTTTKY